MGQFFLPKNQQMVPSIPIGKINDLDKRVTVLEQGGGGSGDITGPASSTDNAVARFDGTTGKLIQNSGIIIDDTDNISGVVNLTQTGYTDISEISEPSSPSSNNVRIYSVDEQFNTRLQYKTADGTVVQLARDNIFIVKNTQGTTITKGQIVYVSGGVGASGTAEVKLAKADSTSTLPAFAIVMDSISNGGFGRVMNIGKLENFDTSAFSEGAIVYLSATTAGEMTDTPPTHPNLTQRLGVIINSHASQGNMGVFMDGVQNRNTSTNNSTFTIGSSTNGSIILANTSTSQRTLTAPDKSGTFILSGDTFSGDLTGTLASGATTLTIANDAVTYAKIQNVTASRLLGRSASGAGDIEEITIGSGLTLTGTTLSASGGGSGDVVGPSSATDNAIARFDTTTGKLIQNSGVIIDDSDNLSGVGNLLMDGYQEIDKVTPPSAPSSDKLRVFVSDVGGRMMLSQIGPSGLDTQLQTSISRNRWNSIIPWGAGVTTIGTIGINTPLNTGTLTGASVSTTNKHTWSKRVDYLVTTPSTSAVAGWRVAQTQFGRGNVSGVGGFHFITRWGPATGVATTTTRSFTGLTVSTSAPTDVEPSSLTDLIGFGWDAADTNMQFFHNDASGTATKVDLGSSFPVPTADRTEVYECIMFCPPNGSTIYYEINDLSTGSTASGSVTTDIPANISLMAPRGWMSVGGTSSVIGYSLMSMYIETDF